MATSHEDMLFDQVWVALGDQRDRRDRRAYLAGFMSAAIGQAGRDLAAGRVDQAAQVAVRLAAIVDMVEDGR
jgi:hypothetical protein